MKRIAYFGTNGGAGHGFEAVFGSFTREEEKEIEKIDMCETIGNGKYQFEFFAWGNYGCLGFPASPDDERCGSKTVVFVEGATLRSEILTIVNAIPFVKSQFNKLAKMYNQEIPKE